MAVGAVAVASRVKASALDAALVLPATSVWRTVTDLAPSPLKVTLVPVPVVKAPPFTLYCQLAPASRPVTLTVPTLVLASPAVPLSVTRTKVGATGTVVSVVLAGASEDEELAAPAPATAKPATTAATTAPADIPPAVAAEVDAAPSPARTAPSVIPVASAALAACANSKGSSASALAAPPPAT